MKTKLLVLLLLVTGSVNASPLNGEISHTEGGVITNHIEEQNVPMPDWMKKNLQRGEANLPLASIAHIFVLLKLEPNLLDSFGR